MHLSLNPYGLTYTLGLQGLGTPRANPHPLGVDGFIAIARELGLGTIELDHRWLTPLDDCRPGARCAIGSTVSSRSAASGCRTPPAKTWVRRCAARAPLGARILRFHLTPVLEGARASWGARWNEMIAHAHGTLCRETRRVADAGLVLAIEDHQDVGSEELVELVEQLGPACRHLSRHRQSVFRRRGPGRVHPPRRAPHPARPLQGLRRAVHDEGYRLVRCAVGDGAVPFTEIAGVLEQQGTPLARLDRARRARITSHPAVHAGMVGRLPAPRRPRARHHAGSFAARGLADHEDCRTPWEKGESGAALEDYELGQVRRSVENVRALGICAT